MPPKGPRNVRYSNPPGGGVFYYLAEPATAEEIAEHGFEQSRAWDPQSTVSLLDSVPRHMGGWILRVALPAEEAAEAMLLEASDHGEGYRRFLVPMALLRSAHVMLVRTPGALPGQGDDSP